MTCSHLFKHFKKQKRSYFGHIKRHSSLEKTVLEGKVEGKRNRGRPRRRWVDDIKEWLQMSVVKAGGLAQNGMPTEGVCGRQRVEGRLTSQTVLEAPHGVHRPGKVRILFFVVCDEAAL